VGGPKEGGTRNQKQEGRNGNQDKALETKGQKWEGQKQEPKVRGQRGSLKR